LHPFTERIKGWIIKYFSEQGYFLKEMVSFGFNVPPGFIITTEVFRGYDAVYGYKYILMTLLSG